MMNENNMLNAKHALERYYNGIDVISDKEILKFANIANLETGTLHDISIIFYSGYRAAIEKVKADFNEKHKNIS